MSRCKKRWRRRVSHKCERVARHMLASSASSSLFPIITTIMHENGSRCGDGGGCTTTAITYIEQSTVFCVCNWPRPLVMNDFIITPSSAVNAQIHVTLYLYRVLSLFS
jgi:hypothetical protein